MLGISQSYISRLEKE
ncbi:hypothetical protein JTS97_00480 [Clostridium botulinum]|nr:hypothetical protein [Clostridium botulinum]